MNAGFCGRFGFVAYKSQKEADTAAARVGAAPEVGGSTCKATDFWHLHTGGLEHEDGESLI